MGTSRLPCHNRTRLESLTIIMEETAPTRNGVMQCQREHLDEDEWPPRTVGERVADGIKFMVCGSLVVIGCLLMAIGAAYIWFYLVFGV